MHWKDPINKIDYWSPGPRRHYFKSLLCGFLQFPDPDVAESGRIVVVLQAQRSFSVLIDFRHPNIGGSTLDFCVILDQHSIVKDRDIGMSLVLTTTGESGSVIDDVVSLSFTRAFGGIDQWHGLLVNGTGLTIAVGTVVVTV